MSLAFHLTLRLATDAVLAPDPPRQRRLARAVLQTCRPWPLLAFRAADTHLHLLALVDRSGAVELSRRLRISLSRSLAHPSAFLAPGLEPVGSARHLRNAFFYVLRQDERHAFHHDPHAEASNLPDLLGLRPLGCWTTVPVRQHLPRTCRADLLALIDPDLDERTPELARLAEATCAAAALEALEGQGDEVTAARTAAVHAGADLRGSALAEALGWHPRSVQRARKQASDPALVKAILGQLRLRGRPLGSPLDRGREPF